MDAKEKQKLKNEMTEKNKLGNDAQFKHASNKQVLQLSLHLILLFHLINFHKPANVTFKG